MQDRDSVLDWGEFQEENRIYVYEKMIRRSNIKQGV